jgi:hypothetical protein
LAPPDNFFVSASNKKQQISGMHCVWDGNIKFQSISLKVLTAHDSRFFVAGLFDTAMNNGGAGHNTSQLM